MKLNLPGIEFDVEIDRKRIHVVCIFSDKNHKKIEKIPTILSKYCFDFNSKNSGDFDCYKQHTFQNILAEINTDVILIAHQKSDVHAKTHSRNLSNVGTSRFNEIISVDYFDAVEFQSGRIEGMLKNYKTDNNLENLRFITGTDCHDWEVYPFQDATKNNIIDFTYMRSLCSFKGLVMALTEPSRLSTSNISIHTPHIRNIQLTIDGEEEKINLSPGINVIIGDNSIGKSLLVQKLFNKSYSVENKGLVTKHSAYLKSKKISINPILDLDNVQYIFRGQGGIRKDFQTDGDISNVTFFKDKFPKVEDEWIKLRLDEHADLVIDNIENNVKTKEAESNLNFTLNIPADISEEFYYLTTKNDLNEYDTKGYGLIENDLNIAIGALNRIMKNEVFSSKDRIEKIIEEIRELILKNNIAKENIKIQNNIINSINEEFKNFNEKYTGKQQSRENQMRNYIVQSDSFINKIEEVIKAKSSKICDPTDNFETIILPIERNPRGNYSFNTKRSKTEITKDDLKIILLGPLTSGVTYESLISRFDFDMLKDNTNKTLASKHIQKQHDNSELYKAMVKDYYETHYLSLDRYISNLSDDLSTGNSPGKNALIYLDVLSQDDTH